MGLALIQVLVQLYFFRLYFDSPSEFVCAVFELLDTSCVFTFLAYIVVTNIPLVAFSVYLVGGRLTRTRFIEIQKLWAELILQHVLRGG